MSYNAALRAIHAGYGNVHWYRGGLEAWQRAGQPVSGDQPQMTGPPSGGQAPMPQDMGQPPQQQSGYPPQDQGGYPQEQGGYPQQQGGYPQQQGGYPQQQGGYPPQQPGNYPPQQPNNPPQQPGNYPPQQPNYPPQGPGGGMGPGGSMSPEQLAKMERQDFGVPATRQLHDGAMHAPTPVSIPGGKLITTRELLALTQSAGQKLVLLEVLGAPQMLPNAFRAVPAAAPGDFKDQTQQQFAQVLQQGTQGRKDTTLVYYCLSNHLSLIHI